MKEWFILVDGKQEGPYSFEDLKYDSRLTPDTLVWKEGFEQWVAIRHVPELKKIFKNEAAGVPIQDLIKLKTPQSKPEQEGTLTLQTDPTPFLFWLIIAILIILYFILQFYKS